MSGNRLRLAPRISATKLAEYLDAHATRRREIIRNQREPRDFVVAQYTPAEKLLVRHLLARGGERSDLLEHAARLRGQPADGWDLGRNALCAEALEAFQGLPREFESLLVGAKAGEQDPPDLELAGVAISVRPELLLRGSARGGSTSLGAVKLYFGKIHPMTDKTGSCAAALLNMLLAAGHAGSGKPDCRRCLVADIFAQRIFTAPLHYRRLLREAEAACEEIASRWDAS